MTINQASLLEWYYTLPEQDKTNLIIDAQQSIGLDFDVLARADFTDKQKLATDTANETKYTLYGGSRGPGKSYWLRWYLLHRLLEFHRRGLSGVDVLLACENYPSLKGRQITKIAVEFPFEIGELKDTQAKGLGFHLFPEYGGGSILLRNLDDPNKYQSFEFADIGIDELTKNPESTFHILRGSLRWPGIKDSRFVAATNPEANWVRDYWIEKRLPDEVPIDPDEFQFVAGLPDDNPHLPDSYWQELDTLPGALRQAWRYGDWYAAVEGLVYENFTADNITDQEPDPERSIELAFDDGYIDPRAILFIQRSDTEILVFDEIYHTKRLEEESLQDVLDRCEINNWPIPDLAVGSSEAVGLKRRFRDFGIASRGGTHKVVEGVNLVRGLICDGKGVRVLKIHKRCKNLIDEISIGFKYPEGRRSVHEKPADGNDHACDALRYWCKSRIKRL